MPAFFPVTICQAKKITGSNLPNLMHPVNKKNINCNSNNLYPTNRRFSNYPLVEPATFSGNARSNKAFFPLKK
jgi:hypothetical protein